MNRLTLEQIRNIQQVEKIKLKLKISLLLQPPRLKRSKRLTDEWLKRYELKSQKVKKLRDFIKKSIREKCSEMLYNYSNKICRDVSRYISSYII
jgi:hypothetical protein